MNHFPHRENIISLNKFLYSRIGSVFAAIFHWLIFHDVITLYIFQLPVTLLISRLVIFEIKLQLLHHVDGQRYHNTPGLPSFILRNHILVVNRQTHLLVNFTGRSVHHLQTELGVNVGDERIGEPVLLVFKLR
ncbi:emb1 [Haliotid herpesvirus 1]|nr:emb1 [Haliotid herpesvirus 1]